MTAGCNLHAVFRVPLLRPALLERGFFRGGVADDPTDISSALRGAGKRRAALTVGRRKNLPLTPDDVTFGSHKIVWWRCQNGRSYRSAVKTRVQGSGCPYCVRKNVLPEEMSLAAEYPALAKEWDTAKNAPLAPNQVLSGSRWKVWWTCANGHSWRAAVFSRTSLGTGCPVCTGKQALAGENDLATLYPDIAAQWDETKNGALHPSNVTAGSHKKVW